MCRHDSQLKKSIHLKYLIFETLLCIKNNNFSFFGLSNLSFFVFTTLKKKIFLNVFSIDLILFQVKAL